MDAVSLLTPLEVSRFIQHLPRSKNDSVHYEQILSAVEWLKLPLTSFHIIFSINLLK